MIDRITGAVLGACAGLLGSVAIALLESQVIHRATHGMGDGSMADNLAFAAFLALPFIGAGVGAIMARKDDLQ